VANSEILKGRGRKAMCQPRCHLSQMHIINYTPFIWEKASSVHSLQILVSACESMLGQLDFAINVRKSVWSSVPF